MRDVISNETIKEINAVIDEILTNIDDNVRNIVGAGNYSLPTIFSYTNYSGQTVSVHGSTFRHEIIIDNADGNNLIGDICTIIGDRNGIKLAKAGVEDRHDAFANYWDSTFDIAYDSDTAINGYVFDMQSGLVGEGTGQSKVMSFKLDNLEAGKAYTLTFCGKFVNAQFVSGQESLVRICSTTAETPYLAQVTLEKDTDAHIYRIDFTNNTQDTTLYLNFWFYGVADDTETYHSEFIADDLIIAGMNIGIISRYIDYNGKWYPIEAGGGTSDLDAIELTYAEYQALTPAEKTDPDKIYFITDYPSGSGVVINPTGTATDTAETIEVDGTIYDFAGTDADAVHTADVGVAGGVAELDANGKVPSSQLPTYPAVGDGTITIQKNGTNVDTFTTNQISNKTVNITMSKSDVGLGNVDNTSDANKPISTATQAALDGKADTSDVEGIKTLTGNPLTLTDGSETYAEELSVDLEPIQSGSGTPSPSNIRPIQGYDIVSVDRCGKNLLRTDGEYGNYTITSAGAYTIGTDRIASDYFGLDENTSIVISGNGHGKARTNYTFSFVGVAFYDESKNFISRISSNNVETLTGTSPANTKYARYFEQIDTQGTNPTPQAFINLKRQVELGSSATTYEPYNGQNISLQLGNKNLLPMTVEGIKAANTDGTWSGNTYTVHGVAFTILTDENGNVVGVKANGTANGGDATIHVILNYESLSAGKYIVNGSIGGSASTYDVYCGFRINGSVTYFNSYNGDSSVITYGASDKIYFIDVRIRNTKAVSNQIFYPMLRDANVTDPTFSPYNPSLGGMVYGATVDVANGVMVVDRACKNIGELNFELYSADSTNHSFVVTAPSDAKPVANNGTLTEAISSSYEAKVFGNVSNFTQFNSAFAQVIEPNRFIVRDVNYTSASAFKTAMASQQIVYPLATPITIPLTPAQLKLLKGYNYITSNGTTIHLTYQPDNAVGDAVGEAEKYTDRVNVKLQKGIDKCFDIPTYATTYVDLKPYTAQNMYKCPADGMVDIRINQGETGFLGFAIYPGAVIKEVYGSADHVVRDYAIVKKGMSLYHRGSANGTLNYYYNNY